MKKYQLNRVRNTEYLKSLSYSSILPPLYFTKRALHDCSKVASRQAVLHHDSQVCFNDNDERVKLSLSSDIESDKQSMWPGCMHTSIQAYSAPTNFKASAEILQWFENSSYHI
jgi:hypothetical protein